MDIELSKLLATMGVGGILAGVMFFFYRKDIQVYTDQWKGQSEMVVQIIKENTSATVKNNVVLDALHRRLDRDEYEKSRETK